MRAQLGFGVGGTGKGRGGDGSYREDDSIARGTTGADEGDDRDGHCKHRLAPRAEAALLIGLPLTKHLGVFAGPVITATKNRDDDDRDRALTVDGERDVRRHGGSVDKAMTAGLRWSF